MQEVPCIPFSLFREHVGALVTVASMKSLTDYLYGKKIPFSIAVIPRYVDALGVYNGGVPMTAPILMQSPLRDG